jgi:hypothetical protein
VVVAVIPSVSSKVSRDQLGNIWWRWPDGMGASGPKGEEFQLREFSELRKVFEIHNDGPLAKVV